MRLWEASLSHLNDIANEVELHSASLCMFLVNMEVSIIGTSLIFITNDLKGFS